MTHRGRPASRLIAGLLPLLLLTLCFDAMAGPPQKAGIDDVFEQFRESLIDYFKQQNYIPVLVNRGYAVGDVVDADGVDFYARSSRCFPKLKVSSPVPAVFADVLEVGSAGVSFALRLKQIFNSEAAAGLQKSIRISFSDVTIVSTTRLDLRAALDRKACPDIAPLVDGTVTEIDRSRLPFFVVSEVASGKRMARLHVAGGADVQASTRQIAGLVADAGLAVKAEGDGTVVLLNDVSMPIAVRPVTIPRVVAANDPAYGLRGGAEGPKLKWDPVDCAPGRSCTAAFAPFADLVKSYKPVLDADELDQ